MLKWDLIVIGAFVVFDDLRNGVIAFLASQDVLSLILILGLVWVMRKKKIAGLGFDFGGGFAEKFFQKL